MKFRTILLFAAVSFFTTLSCAPKTTEWTGWTNPLFEGQYADPEGIMIGDELWIYPTSSYPFEQQLYMDAFSSKDLKTWTKHSNIITNKEISWLRKALWAPAIVHKDGKFYLFFACNDVYEGDTGGIGVAVSDKPEGPFQDLRLFAMNPLDNVLDAGRYLLPLSVSSLWNGTTSKNIYVDVTVRDTYSDPDGYELYMGNDMFTVFYLNTAVFDPRLANDFILENISDRNYHRGLGNIVNLRQASIFYDSKVDKVELKLNNDLRYVLEHFTERVLPVQESGRKVCICIDGGAQGIGFCNLTDNQIGEFARSVKKVVDYYGLDGVNLWDRNANYAVSEEKGFQKTNTTSYPRLIKKLRELLGPNKLLTVTDYEEPTEYFWDTEATGGIRVGEFIDYAWSGYCANDEPVQIVDPWHKELPSVSKLHPRKPFAGLNPRRYGVSNVTCYRKQDDSLFALEQYDKSEFTNSNISVFYDVRSILQDSYEGANIMDAFIRVWYGSYLQISPRRLTNYVFTPSHPTNYNKWGKDW